MSVLPTISDAIIVLPGTLGSELIDHHGSRVWGDKHPLSRVALRRVLDGLVVTEEELGGTPRFQPGGLIQRTVVLPRFGVQGPYRDLLRQLESISTIPECVTAFPYDWRLSRAHNAALLIPFALDHLDRCQTLIAERKAQGDPAVNGVDPTEVRLRFVAHSTGGLIAREACQDDDLRSCTRHIVTLGAPFAGSTRILDLFGAATSSEHVDEQAAGRLALTCPGFYDLLPRGREVVSNLRHSRALDELDLDGLGARRSLAGVTLGASRAEKLDDSSAVTVVPFVGSDTPTPAQIQEIDGRWRLDPTGPDTMWVPGDGTVPSDDLPAGSRAVRVPVTHQDIPDSPWVLQRLITILLEGDESETPRPALPEIGLSAPFTASPGTVAVQVNARDSAAPGNLRVSSRREYQTGKWYRAQPWDLEPGSRAGTARFHAALHPGIYRVTALLAGQPAVSATLAVVSRS